MNQPKTDMLEIPTATGKVVVPAELKSDVDQFHYAPARRVGEFVYLSGIVACNREPEPMEKVILFGPFATWSSKFLKNGSYFDLVKATTPSNVIPQLQVGAHEFALVKFRNLLRDDGQSQICANAAQGCIECGYDCPVVDTSAENCGMSIQHGLDGCLRRHADMPMIQRLRERAIVSPGERMRTMHDRCQMVCPIRAGLKSFQIGRIPANR